MNLEPVGSLVQFLLAPGPLLFIAFVLAIMISLGIQKTSKFRYVLMETARTTGLDYVEMGFFYLPKLAGTIRGRDIMVYSFIKYETQKPHERGTTFTRIEAHHSGKLTADISISRGSAMTTLADRYGVHDIHTLNPKFDGEFNVMSHSTEEVQRVVDMQVQELLLKAKLPVDITKTHVVHEKPGLITDVDYLRNAIDLVVKVADRMDDK